METSSSVGLATTAQEIDFVTMGMFIIDDIQPSRGAPVIKDIAGGGGAYAMLGARLFSPPPQSKSLGWIVDAGSDFPDKVREGVVVGWSTNCLLRVDQSRLTTGAYVGYDEDGVQIFRYTTPKLQPNADSVTPEVLSAKAFHLICSPDRCVELTRTIRARRQSLGLTNTGTHKAEFIWEPMPASCVPEQLEACKEALDVVDIFSPNHVELCRFFGVRDVSRLEQAEFTKTIEDCCEKMLDFGVGWPQGAIIVRSGRLGCLVAGGGPSNDIWQWMPAYYRSETFVKDPTGGGNAFLGGLAISLARTLDGSPGYLDETRLRQAVAFGSVAASFVIEQVGLPTRAMTSVGDETWNGTNVFERLGKYSRRLDPAL